MRTRKILHHHRLGATEVGSRHCDGVVPMGGSLPSASPLIGEDLVEELSQSWLASFIAPDRPIPITSHRIMVLGGIGGQSPTRGESARRISGS